MFQPNAHLLLFINYGIVDKCFAEIKELIKMH